jgi:N6-L-threonylcarbamoyladenine synthase
MITLGLDTSCDDTCVSLLEIESCELEILANFISSQVKIHKKYGGVFPTLAKREHKKNLPIVFKKALKEAKIKESQIDLISVTIGPGLEPCLWVGVNFAKDLAKKLKIPIVPVNHVEAHILVNFVNNLQLTTDNLQLFPAICLVVSGGHTQLILMKGIGKYKILGETRDDAAGECFDKVARLLELGYPGGPAIEKFSQYAIRNTKYQISLPRPMIKQKNYDFSFAGLKTAVLYDFKDRPKKIRESKIYKILMAKEVQQAVIDVLISKTIRAVKELGAKSIILGGGVAANRELRKQFKFNIEHLKSYIELLIPPKELCTDNGLMVGVAGYFNKERATKNFDKIKAEPNLKI